METPSADDDHSPPDESRRSALFFSYARADQQRALPIIRALEHSGHTVWWDGLIDSGARFAALTEQALCDASAVVVVWSATSAASHWVNDEATSARDRGILVPVTIDGTEPPIGFRQFQVIDLSQWSGDPAAPEFARVLRGIEAAGARRAQRPVANTAPPAAATPVTARAPSRRTLLQATGAVVGVAALAGTWAFDPFDSDAPGDRSIAVLPFENIGGGTEQDYFAEGLAAELRAQLTRNAALRVIAQSTSQAVAAGDGDAAAIARRLGVAFLLEGNVRWAQHVVRISANLIDRATSSSRWSKTFDLAMGNIFAVQSEIAAAVTAAISSQIVEGSSSMSSTGGTADVAAFDQYLRGRDLYNRAASENMDVAALAHFDAAIGADANFAAAHAARARSLTLIGSLYGSLSETRANYAAALAAARRAVALAPEHAESQSTLGFVLSQAQLDVRAARGPFDRARALGGGDANVLARFAQYAAQTGRRVEAHAAIDRAITLDPLNPLMLKSAGLIAYWSRRYEAALPPLRRALQLSPDLGAAHAPIGDVLLVLGRLAEARAEYARETTRLLRETGLAIVEFKLGNRAAAAAARQRIITGLGTDQVTHYQQAQIAAQWGEPDVAITALLASQAAGDSGLLALKVDPLLDPVRQRPAFATLMAALHFD